MLIVIEMIPPDPVVIIERKDYCFYMLTIYYITRSHNNNNTLRVSSIYTRCTLPSS